MENRKIGFIGGGNMGGALATAAIRSLGSENVLLSDSNPTTTKVLSQNIGATPSTHKEIAETCRLIFIAVKPNVVPAVLETLKPLLAKRTDNYALVSIAAGVTVDSILEIVGKDVHVIRMMPNTAVAVGQGMIVFVPHCDDEDVRIFEDAMANAGMVSSINENLIDAATAVMGCGPAFAYLFIEALADGGVDILVGTHAVIEDNVLFHKLGLVVIDEQHRFGVAQRAKLWMKNAVPPHVLVMTATPIPRTLAMTLYGDLDVSVIDELPPGRKPIQTIHQFDNRRASLYAGIRKQIGEGRQIYIVYPLIKESEKIDIKNLEEGYEHVCAEFPECKVSKVHGQMKPAEKDAEMQRFVNGETQIMVATTVIEVGVNVPNASVMVIENAERFGLSQLHQLRGRVGRGADQSYCILVTSYKLSEETRKRLEIMVQTNDGFEIAEADLKLRGPGDLEGTQQSGVAFDLKIADIAKDGQLLQHVREIALKVIENDPAGTLPENEVLWRQLQALRKTNVNWAAIS